MNRYPISNIYTLIKPSRMFENDLMYLAKNFNLITYDELEAHYSGGTKLKPNSVILTFDDGFSECFSIVRPLLLKHGIPCTFFIPTSLMNNGGMSSDLKASLCIDRLNKTEKQSLEEVITIINNEFNWDFSGPTDLKQLLLSSVIKNEIFIDRLCKFMEIDIQQYLRTHRPYMSTEEIIILIQDGFTIGAHSTGHQKLSLLPESQIEKNISDSCIMIKSLTGKNKIPFAFPYSADGISRDLLKDIRNRNKSIGLFFNTNGIQQEQNYIISRMCGDSPLRSTPENSNLALKFIRAYLEDISFRIRGF